ncbi:hypothetical protein [Zobellia laminariae]|uniref:hypothetical protein n=1 Tax=Zobellia laminariae TaxID=248906 RepID=UPI0040572B1F
MENIWIIAVSLLFIVIFIFGRLPAVISKKNMLKSYGNNGERDFLLAKCHIHKYRHYTSNTAFL